MTIFTTRTSRKLVSGILAATIGIFGVMFFSVPGATALQSHSASSTSAEIEDPSCSVSVRGYSRSNGTYVRPHSRSCPDGNLYNNRSYRGSSYSRSSYSYSRPSYSYSRPSYNYSRPSYNYSRPLSYSRTYRSSWWR